MIPYNLLHKWLLAEKNKYCNDTCHIRYADGYNDAIGIVVDNLYKKAKYYERQQNKLKAKREAFNKKMEAAITIQGEEK